MKQKSINKEGCRVDIADLNKLAIIANRIVILNSSVDLGLFRMEYRHKYDIRIIEACINSLP